MTRHLARFAAALILSFAVVHTAALACSCTAECIKSASPTQIGPIYPATITYEVAFHGVSVSWPGDPICGSVATISDSLCGVQSPSPCSTMKVAGEAGGADVTLPFTFPSTWASAMGMQGVDALTYAATLTWEQCTTWGTPNGDGTYTLHNLFKVNENPPLGRWSPAFQCEQVVVCNPPPPPPPPGEGCTATVGYWKTHAAGGKYDSTWDSVGGPSAPFFGSGQTWLQVLSSPTKTDKYYILARQFIAAVLNGYAGASQDAVGAALVEAEAFFAANAPVSWDRSFEDALLRDAALLDGYNNGLAGPPHCD